MNLHQTPGACHERPGPLSAWSLPRGNTNGRNGRTLRPARPSAASTPSRPALGSALRGDDPPLASGRQKHRWPTWLALGCLLVCALGGVDAGETPRFTPDGSVSGRECGRTGVHWASVRPRAADSRPFQHRPGLRGPWQDGYRRGQRVDSPCGARLWLCRPRQFVERYDGAGVTHWPSQRTGHLAGLGATLWSGVEPAETTWRDGGRGGLRAGADGAQVGQRTSPLYQGQGGKARGVDPDSERGGAGDGANPPPAEAVGVEPGPRHSKRHSDAWAHARGDQAADGTDCAVADHGGGGQRQNRACRHSPSTCDRAQQGGQEGGVWLAVSAQSPGRGLYLWDVDPGGGGRDEDALAGIGGLPRDFWSRRHAGIGGVRPRWRCHEHPQATGQGGGHADWHSAQRPGSMASCRGSPRAGSQRAGSDRRGHRHLEKSKIQVQQTQRTSLGDAGDGRAEVYLVIQSEQADAGCSRSWPVREDGIGSDRSEKPMEVGRGSKARIGSTTLERVLRHVLSSKFGVPLVVGGTYGAIIQHIEPHHIVNLPVPRFGDAFEERVHKLIQEAAKLRLRFQAELETATQEFFEAAGLPGLYQMRWHSQPRDLGFVIHGLNATSLRALNFAPRFTNIVERLKSVHHRTLGELCAHGQLSSGVRFKRIDCDPEHGAKLIGQRQAFWLRPEGRWISPRP